MFIQQPLYIYAAVEPVIRFVAWLPTSVGKIEVDGDFIEFSSSLLAMTVLPIHYNPHN